MDAIVESRRRARRCLHRSRSDRESRSAIAPPPARLPVILRAARLLPLLLLAGCTPVAAFNALVPKDTGAVRVARGEPFAPGARGTLDIYAPALAYPRPRPVILFFYGGAWNSGAKEGYGFAARALAARGFVVAVPDYRLVPEVRYPAFIEDGAAAVRWVRAHAGRFGGDPDRILLVGHSAGAYNAGMLALDPRWLGEDRKAVRGFVGLAGPYDFLPEDTKDTRAAFADASDPEATQPIRFASRDDPPSFLAAGGRDRLVLPSQTTGLAIALGEAGAEVTTRIYPDLGHVGIVTALARPFRGKAPVLGDIVAFARKATGDGASTQ